MTSPSALGNYIGRPVPRREDLRLITGKGRYGDDYNLDGQAYAAMVRSPYPHARIVSISVEAAQQVPGVLAVFTGEDVLEDGLNPIPHDHMFIGKPEQMRNAPDVLLVNKDGSDFRVPPHAILPHDRTRFVGEAVAMVVAETLEAARDAAEHVEIEYEELPFAIAAAAAAEPGAPLVWDEIRSNTCVDAEVGDGEAVDAIFAAAPKVVALSTHIQRVTGVTMEPRTATGSYDPSSGRYTLYAGSSGVVRHKFELAAVLGVPESKVRVIAHDVGGNFGTRNNFYPEFGLVVWASRRVGRPIKWTCERQEAFLSDYQGRDLTVAAELALDEDGRFLAVRSDNISNVGAYFASFQPLRKGIGLMTNVYDVSAAHVRARAVVTNTVCTTPFRSAGRPEAIFVIERLIDMAARRHGFDRVELRRKNLVRPDMFPYANPLTLVYDNGDYGATMDAALRLIDWDGFAERRKAACVGMRRRGIAIANYVEITTGMPREKAEIRIDADKGVDVVIGTMSSGQGHETSFAQITAEWLGVPLELVRLTTGDTDSVSIGGGSISGRSMRFASVVIARAIEQIVDQARQVVAFLHNMEPRDVTFDHGVFRAGTASYGILDVARKIAGNEALPQGLNQPLYGECDHFFKEAAFPFGAQACEVEVDLQTGMVEIVNIAAVDDVGKAINPLILHGQTIGGAVQGLGQALMEQVCYDPDTGQNITGSLMDYALPRADGMPDFEVEISEQPSPTNPLGIRAGGEGGTTPALAVLVNAVVDALGEFGVEHIEMPLTPERVWQALEPARRDGRILG
jgi:carbon-monoxide dehydrogenase large subunit